MGSSDDPASVADSELRMQGIIGLRITDAAILPNVTSGNINAPTVMVAKKAADMIRRKYTVTHQSCFLDRTPEKRTLIRCHVQACRLEGSTGREAVTYAWVIWMEQKKMVSIATELQSRISLNDGETMPLFGLGHFKSANTEDIVLHAINHGYRLIDTAEYHGNEEHVGNAVRKSRVPREDLFVVSKLWENGAAVCKEHFEASLKRLNIGYLDMYMIHSPLGGKNVETYKIMMELQEQGKVKSIGVSNFGIHHLQGLEKAGLPLPVVNQIELHPWQQKRDIVQYCREKGIVLEGYSPIAKGLFLNNDLLVAIAKRANKTPAQILLRWSVQKGFVPIPKTSTLQRIEENSDVFDWSIPDEDMEILNDMPQMSVAWNPCVIPWEG